jgi:hypothetical protein
VPGARHELAGVLTHLDWLTGLLGARKAEFEKKSSVADVALATKLAIVARQGALLLENGSGDFRDQSMAENLRALLDEDPSRKIVAWAHNGHVDSDQTRTAMGGFLRKALGAQLRVVGFAFDQGSFRAYGPSRSLDVFTVGAAPPQTLEAALARIGLSICAVPLDTRVAPEVVRNWASKRRLTRSVGSGFDPNQAARYFLQSQPERSYDLVVFVKVTTASRMLPDPTLKAPSRPNSKPLNLDFSAGRLGQIPQGWIVPVHATKEFEVRVAEIGPRPGLRSAALELDEGADTIGTLMQRVDASKLRGRKVRLRASVRTEPGSIAQLWLRIDRPAGRSGFFDDMQDRPIESATFNSFELAGEVAADAEAIVFGMMLTSPGKAWLSDVHFEAVP